MTLEISNTKIVPLRHDILKEPSKVARFLQALALGAAVTFGGSAQASTTEEAPKPDENISQAEKVEENKDNFCPFRALLVVGEGALAYALLRNTMQRKSAQTKQ